MATRGTRPLLRTIGAAAAAQAAQAGTPRAPTLQRHVTTRIPTAHGVFDVSAFTCESDDARAGPKEHLALAHGDLRRLAAAGPVLCRVHSECLTGEVLRSRLCDCGEQLDRSMARVVADGGGVVLYLRQEGRGIGLLDKLRAYNLQAQGHDTVEANRLLGRADDERDFGVAARMLAALGVRSIRLMTNNPAKVAELTRHGIHVAERLPLVAEDVSEHNAGYLRTKMERMGHVFGKDTGDAEDDGGSRARR